jgi:hypothetical protein
MAIFGQRQLLSQRHKPISDMIGAISLPEAFETALVFFKA